VIRKDHTTEESNVCDSDIVNTMTGFGTILLSSILLTTTIAANPVFFTTTASSSDLPLASSSGTSNNEWDQSSWSVGTDGVMGGQSSGYVSYSNDPPNETMTFHGTINTNGGGFANVGRRFSPSLDLTPYAGIVVEMEAELWIGGVGRSQSSEGGEKPLGFHLQMGDTGYYGFSSAFAVPLAQEDGLGTMGVYLPLDSFDRSSRNGWQCTTGCKLDITRVNEMEIYALFQKGSFRIDLKSITAVTDPKSFRSPLIIVRSGDDIEALIEATIISGSKVNDYGYREICIAIYWSTLNTILEASGLSDAVKEVACAGVKKVESYGDKVENARNLRYTLDALLADVKGAERNENSPAWLPVSNVFVGLEERCRGYTSFPSRSPEPTPSPAATPTMKPVATCVDNRSYKFKGKKGKSCIWISKIPKRTKNMCKKKVVRKNCMIVCGTCCGDDLTRKFKIGKKKTDQQKKSCNYLGFEKRKHDVCPRKGVNAICAKTCGRCCSNVKDFEVDTPQGPKKCSWVAAKTDRKDEYCKIPEVNTGCARGCDSCTDYTIPKTDSPTKSPVISPTPAPINTPVNDVTRAHGKLDDD